MEGSKGFQDSMQTNYLYQYQSLTQPMGPNQQFQGQILSQPMSQTQPFQGEHLSQPIDPNQPFEGQHSSEPMGRNQPYQGEYLSQPMTHNQPFQGQPLNQPMGQNQPFQGQPLNQPMSQNQPFQGQPLSQPMSQIQPFQGPPLSQLRPLNQPFQDEHFSNIFTLQDSNCLNWTYEMARLLITAISYISEAESSTPRDESSSRKKFKLIPKMTMWNVISTVMKEKGFIVSPQQCEEKFGEINNKYKQMISLLGRATSCKVVENPILLDSINMPENKKDEARKLLHSEQFLYREMCSFHHGNRLFLPHDWELRRSVFMNLKNQQSRVLRARWAETEVKSLEIQEQRLQFEKERFEWMCFTRNEDLKLEKMRLENESMKLENAKLAFELKRGKKFSDDENK